MNENSSSIVNQILDTANFASEAIEVIQNNAHGNRDIAKRDIALYEKGISNSVSTLESTLVKHLSNAEMQSIYSAIHDIQHLLTTGSGQNVSGAARELCVLFGAIRHQLQKAGSQAKLIHQTPEDFERSSPRANALAAKILNASLSLHRDSTFQSSDGLFALGTTKGEHRQENQDSIIVARLPHSRSQIYLAAVCDGIGGMQNGREAAHTAAAFFVAWAFDLLRGDEYKSPPDTLLESPDILLGEILNIVNAKVHKKFHGRGGTTLAAALVTPSSTTATGIGDSRVYGRKLNSKQLEQYTIDDTLSSYAKEYSAQLSIKDRKLVQYIGSPDVVEPICKSYVTNDLQGLYLLSDGIHGIIGDSVLSRVAHNAAAPKRFVERVLAISNWLGTKDNSSTIAFDLSSMPLRSNTEENQYMEVWLPSNGGYQLLFDVDQYRSHATDTLLNSKAKTREKGKKPSRKKGGRRTRTKIRDHETAEEPLKIQGGQIITSSNKGE